MTNLFSSYRQGENCVTASILAVLERLSFPLVERILQALCDEPNKPLFSFTNQPRFKSSVPDARIRASFSYWIETKTAPNRVYLDQICKHLESLEEERKEVGVDPRHQRLLVLTPDARRPAVLDKRDHRVVWNNFEELLNILQELVTPPKDWFATDMPIASEQERWLLRELASLLVAEGLVGAADDRVLVVAARTALQEYLDYGVYMCQPNRTFQPSTHLAFYADGRIHRRVPSILGHVESVVLSEEGVAPEQGLSKNQGAGLLRLIARLRDEGSERIESSVKVLFLSAPDDSQETISLPDDVENDLVTASGKAIAFTQGQRYVSLSRLLVASRTSELINSSFI